MSTVGGARTIFVLSSGRSAGSNRRFQFHKRSQLLIRAYNEMLSVAAMRVCNPDHSPVEING
jgi:hypothetical protein